MKKIYLYGALASTLVVVPATSTVFAEENAGGGYQLQNK